MKPYIKNQQKAGRKRTTLMLVGLLLLIVLGLVGLKALRDRGANQPTPPSEETIIYAPATEEEQQEADRHKEDLGNPPEQNPPSSDKKSVTPVITDAGQYDDKVEVRAYIPGIIESDGKCVITLKKGAAEVTRTVDGMAGPQATQCEPTGIPRSEFPSTGEWTLTVAYSSSKSSGLSEPWKVEVN